MAVSVFPERMNKLDPEDVSASLRTIEDYIGYITERTEYALTNTFRTTTNLGGASAETALVLEEMSENFQAFESETSSTLTSKVDKVDGMGLSHNDYTDTDKNKLHEIDDGAEVNVIETVKQNGTDLPVTGKAVNITVPTKVSQIVNDSEFQTSDQVQAAIGTAMESVAHVINFTAAYAPGATKSWPETGRQLCLYLIDQKIGVYTGSLTQPGSGSVLFSAVVRTGSNVMGCFSYFGNIYSLYYRVSDGTYLCYRFVGTAQ